MDNQNNVDLLRTNEEILVDLGNICRFCLSETENGISLNEKCLPGGSVELGKETILNFVIKSRFIKMEDSKSYPSQACKYCYNLVKVCYNFSQMCQKSDDSLRNCFENYFHKTQEKLIHSGNTDFDTSIKVNDQEACMLDMTQMKPGDILKESVSSLETYKQKLGSLSGKIKEVQSDCSETCVSATPFLKNEEADYVCTLCSLKFNNSKDLSWHIVATHKQKKFKFKCKNCSELFSDKEKLKQHFNLIHKISDAELINEYLKKIKDRNFICFHCVPHKNVQSQDQLIGHFEEMHKNEKFHAVSKTYSCTYCSNSMFSTKLSLNEHLLLVHNLKDDESPAEMFVSISPSQNETDLSAFLNILDSVVDSISIAQQGKNTSFKLFCKNCARVLEFTTTHDFINHLRTHHDQSKLLKSETKKDTAWNCTECPASYNKKQSLYYHMKGKHKNSNLTLVKCPEPNCLQSFATNRKLIRHGITVHQKYFACFHEVFKKVLEPAVEEEKIRVKNFECDICQRKYTYKPSLRKHILTSHLGKSVKNDVFCSYCGKTLSSKLNLKSHIEFVHEPLFVSCPICKKKVNFRAIGKHYKLHKNSDMVYSKNSFLCNLCGKILKSKRSFEDHQKLHKNIRNELCDICGSGFTTKKILRLHKKTHEGRQRKMFKCDQCEKVFSGRHTLNRHLLTHSGKKNFICEICSKCFYTLQELNRHVRYHRKEYRFDCQLCDMRFLDKSRFRHHMMRHRNVRPHKCQFCGKMFIVRGKMNLHLAAKHNIEVQNTKGIWKDPKTYVPLDDLL